jgi:hypothetical protein
MKIYDNRYLSPFSETLGLFQLRFHPEKRPVRHGYQKEIQALFSEVTFSFIQ